MKYDLVIVVASQDHELIRMTQAAIDSCLADGADVNVIVVETFKKTRYRGADTIIEYSGQFNYNRALNMGIKEAKGDVVILANNDIKFEPGWSTIGQTMIDNGYLSASALSTDPRQNGFRRGDYAYEGYSIGVHLCGWCIFCQRKVFEKIGQLDESVVFWYSDNLYAKQLKRAGIKHALICNVVVLHYTSQTLSKKRRSEQNYLTYAQGKRILKVNPKNL